MSAAEAGSSPDVPRLRLAAPAAGQDDGDPGASPPGGGAEAEPGPAAPEPDGGWPRLAATDLRATELRVREVRVVREARVRTLQGSRSVAARARTASQARAVHVQAATGAQVVNQAASQAWAASAPARAAAGTRPASQARVVTHRRAAVQTRVMTRTRTARPGAVRLTRRGRLVVTGLALLVAIATATLLWMSVAGSVQAASRGGPAPGSPYQGMTQTVVQPGQTLWSIATAAQPSANAWAVVQQIVEVNALNGPQVHAGEVLWVPRG